MGVELRKGRNGRIVKNWYGRIVHAGKHSVFSLGVKVKGTPPPNLHETGDAAFEASRLKAEAKLEEIAAESKQKGQAAHLVERMIESKTGQAVEHVQIADLFTRWQANSPGCDAHKKHADATFKQFAVHVAKVQADAVLCYSVTRATVESWADHLRAHLTPTTAKRKLRILKSAFARSLPIGAKNPFDPLPWTHGTGAGEEINRRPLSEAELARLIEIARQRAPILHPLIVCAANTGLRRGDVCRLGWEAVRLDRDELVLRTSKTGEAVTIPLLPELRKVLKQAEKDRNPGARFVWPLAARMIESNPNGLTLPFKRIAAEALGRDIEAETPQDAAAITPLADILPAVETAVTGRYEGDKLARVLDILRRHAAGESAKRIGKATGRQTARITETLHAAERWAGLRFMPTANNAVHRNRAIADATRRDRPHGARAASLIDWHCLRTTFVTRALTGGMRIIDLQKLTGHRIVETVTERYYKPDTGHIRLALESAMLPKAGKMITGGTPAAPGDALAGLADAVKGLSRTDRAKLVKLLNKGAA